MPLVSLSFLQVRASAMLLRLQGYRKIKSYLTFAVKRSMHIKILSQTVLQFLT